MKYSEPPHLSRAEALRQLKENASQRIVDALLSLSLNDDEWRFVQEICITYSKHRDSDVRGIAILCLGHLARIHHTTEIGKTIPVILGGLNDKCRFVRGHAQSALDDVLFFAVPERFNKVTALKYLNSQNVANILFGLSYIRQRALNLEFAIENTKRFVHHPHEVVRGIASLGIGCIASKRPVLYKDIAHKIIEEALEDQESIVREFSKTSQSILEQAKLDEDGDDED